MGQEFLETFAPASMKEMPLKQGRSILMVAFHFPPSTGSSGHLRTLSFVKELPYHDWNPIVLTANRRAYPEIGHADSDSRVAVPVHRAFALDSARHFGVRGRYLRHSALPDRWVTWAFGAVPLGLLLIARHRPAVIWTTYPIATAHLIGLYLHKLTGIPWVADFRDPMLEIDPYTGEHYPPEPLLWRARSWIESKTLQSCTCSVFVSPGARKICADRYPAVAQASMKLIPNGYDEQAFQTPADSVSSLRKDSQAAILLHSGLLYPTPDRDPKDFFAALSALKNAGKISANMVRIVLRATGHDQRYRLDIERLGIQDLVTLEPSLPYGRALQEMLSADGLLLFQGRPSNSAIPAKLYEYLRACRPIFAMVHHQGDTAGLLGSLGVGRIVPLDSREAIAHGLLAFLDEIRRGNSPVLSATEVAQFTRKARAAELARLLQNIAS